MRGIKGRLAAVARSALFCCRAGAYSIFAGRQTGAVFFCVCTDFATKKLLLAKVDTKFFSVIYFQLLKRNTKCDALTVSF